MSTVLCWDVSTAIFTISKHASPDLFVNHMTFSFSQFVTYHRDHYLFGCVSWQELFLLTWDICLSSEADNRMYIVSSSLMRVVFNSRLFLAAFRYISIILFRVAMVFGEEVNLHQGHGALFQAHNLSLHHLHDLPNENVSAGCPNYLCMGLHLPDSYSCTFTPSPVIPPVTRSLNDPCAY